MQSPQLFKQSVGDVAATLTTTAQPARRPRPSRAITPSCQHESLASASPPRSAAAEGAVAWRARALREQLHACAGASSSLLQTGVPRRARFGSAPARRARARAAAACCWAGGSPCCAAVGRNRPAAAVAT